MLRYHVYKDEAGEWRWRAKARNGRIVGDSGEGYEHRSDCLDGLLLLVPDADVE